MHVARARLVLPALVAAGLVAAPVSASADVVVQPVVSAYATAPVADGTEITATVDAHGDTLDRVVAEIAGGTPVPMHLDAERGVWTTGALSQTAEAGSLGHQLYASVLVEAWDGSQVGSVSGRLDYRFQVADHGAQAATAALDLAHPSTVVTGDLFALDPATAQTNPLQHTGLQVSDGSSVFTDDAGHYSYTWRPTQALTGATTFHPSVVPVNDPTIATQAGVGYGAVEVTATPVASPRLTVATPARVDVPAGVALTTALTSAGHGLGGVPLRATRSGQTSSSVVTTGPSGTAVLSVRPTTTGAWRVAVPASSPAYPYLGGVSATVTTAVRLGTRLTWSKPAINEYSELHIAGTLTTSSGAAPATGSRVHVQERRAGRSTWSDLGSVPTTRGGAFSLDGYVPHPAGSYRLVYAANGSLQGSTSRTVTFTTHETRVASFKVARTKVKKGRTDAITGTVQQLSGSTWKSIGTGRYVDVYFQAKGAKKPAYQGWVKTDSHGRFTVPARPKKTGRWSVVWWRTSTAAVDAFSSAKTITVTS